MMVHRYRPPSTQMRADCMCVCSNGFGGGVGVAQGNIFLMCYSCLLPTPGKRREKGGGG